MTVSIEVLHTPDCPHWRAARDAVARVAREERVTAAVSETVVETAQAAVKQRFPGSPTVRINGCDVQPEADEGQQYGLG